MRISGAARLAAIVMVVASIGACTSSVPPTKPAAYAAPAIAGTTTIPFRVTMDDTSADITLNGVHYVPITGEGAGQDYAIVDVTIIGRSVKPFRYDAGAFFFQYAAGPDPYHPQDTSIWGVQLDDWLASAPALLSGYLQLGTQIRANVTFRVNPQSPLLIGVISPKLATVVEWLSTSP